MTEQVTQEQVNEAFKSFKDLWDQAVIESGETESMFIALGLGTNMLAAYQEIKEEVESLGLVMPTLKEGLEVRFND